MKTRSPRRSFLRPLRCLPLLAVLALSGCSSSVEVAAPALEGDDLNACEALVDGLPDTLFGQERRDISGATETSAAWGDPAVVLECGARAPQEFDAFSRCSEVDGVGWFMPDSALKDPAKTLVITAQSHRPRLSVTIPAEFRQQAPDTQLKILGGLVTEHLEEVQPCT